MMLNLILAQQAESGVLISWWKMLLMLPPIMAWAWLIATKLDKDARYFHLNHLMWNGIHLGAGVAAIVAMLFAPIFWLGWPLGVVFLLSPVLIYWRLRNQAVPEPQRFYLTSESLGAKLASRRLARAAKFAAIRFTDSSGKSRNPPLKEDPLYPIHIQAEDLLGPAVAARAARVELGVGKNGGLAVQTIDGLKYKRENLPTETALRVVDYFKDLAGLDLSDRRKQQSGRFQLTGPNGESDVTLTTAGSSTGLVARIDFDLGNRLNRPIDSLGLLTPQLESLRLFELPHERHGVILVGAPSGHGLTTTAYSFVSRHDAYTSNVKTLEREILVDLEGVDQVRWDPANPNVDYSTNLQSILRRDPDIVLMAELRDRDTAQVAAEPGIQGPLIYIPQPLPTIVDQIRDWVKKVGDVKEAAKGLRAVTNQRLVRSLCPNCRQAYQPTPEQLKKLHLSSKKVNQLHRASGKVQVKNRIENCPICGGTGYLGQTAAFEVMIVDDEARKLLAAGDLKAALSHARRNNMYYLQEAALSKVISGETTVEEVARVMASSTPEAKPAGGVAA